MIAWARAWVVAAALAVAGGACGEWAALHCRSEYGYVDASEADPVSRETPAQVGARCVQEGGRDCDAAKFISQEAAECVARMQGLPAGIRPWRTGLVYHVKHRTVIWGVDSTTSSEGV